MRAWWTLLTPDIGRAVVARLLEAGAVVLAVDVAKPDLKGADGFACDLGDRNSIHEFAQEVKKK